MKNLYAKNFYMLKETKISYILYTLFSLGQKSSVILTPLVTKSFIDASQKGDIELLKKNGIIILVVTLVFTVFLCLKIYFQKLTEVNISNSIRKRYSKHINTMPFNDLIQYDTGYFYERLNIDIDKSLFILVSGYVNLIINIIFIAGVFIVMFYLNKLISMILLGVLPIFIMVLRAFAPMIRKFNKKSLEFFEAYNSFTEEQINGNYTIRSLGLYNRYENLISEKISNIKTAQMNEEETYLNSFPSYRQNPLFSEKMKMCLTITSPKKNHC